MFTNVITGNLTTFTFFQGHILGQGHVKVNKFIPMCTLSCNVGMPNMKTINITVIEISLKMSYFDISPLGAHLLPVELR